MGSLGLPESIDRAIAAGVRETIVVLPDAFTKYSGSMFSNSPTIGDWEMFIAHDLTAAIDARYRTIATREGRGLAGHSMGGYGTMRIGMKQPAAFAAMYAMSSCCLMNEGAGRGAGPGRGDAAGRGAARLGAVACSRTRCRRRRQPGRPRESCAGLLRFPTRDGEVQPLIAAQWIANSPLVMVGQYGPALASMRAIALDVGDKDPFVTTNRQLADALARVGAHPTIEVYEGDHGNRIRERFETKVLPFFSQHLAAAR